MIKIIIISAIVAIISLIGVVIAKKLSSKKFWNTFVGPICIIVFFCAVLFGLGLFPFFEKVTTQHEELQKYEIVKGSESITINFDSGEYVKYISHKAYMEFGDSTKIFIEKDKSFYGVTTYSRIVWSNPPYEIFHRE